jgi:hypothetical protein
MPAGIVAQVGCTSAFLGQRKKDLFQSRALGATGDGLEFNECPAARESSVVEKYESIADALSVPELMNGKHKRSTCGGDLPQQGNNL